MGEAPRGPKDSGSRPSGAVLGPTPPTHRPQRWRSSMVARRPSPGLYLHHRRGTNIRVYRNGRSRRLTWGLEPTWSARGLIAFNRLRGRSYAIYVMRGDGSHVRRVVAGSNPDWSPHGSWITFSRRDGGIGLVRPNGSGERRLTAQAQTAPRPNPASRPTASTSCSVGVTHSLCCGWPTASSGRCRNNSVDGRGYSFAENDWQPLRSRR